MRAKPLFCVVVTALFSSLLLTGCGSGSQDTELDPAGLEAAFEGAPAEPAASESGEESTTEAIVLPGTSGAAGTEVSMAELASQAATAIRKDEVAEAMVLLQTLRRARNLSPDQLTVVQDQMAALQSDLANKAASGDPRAKQALELIGQSTRW